MTIAAPIAIGVGKPVVFVDAASLPIIFAYSICSAVIPVVLVSPFTVKVAKYQTTRIANSSSTDSAAARTLREAFTVRRAS